MTTSDFKLLASQYKMELLVDVLPFWEKYSIDRENGGFFTCLDRQGNCYDTDKFVWLQGRQVWMFSFLYNNFDKREEWLDIALNGAEFLKKYGRDAEGNFYFSLTREGKPLIQPYNIFSDCFATMAFSQLAKATGNSEYADIATDTFNNILKRRENPKGKYSKNVPESRPLKGFSLPMILCNLSLETEHLIDKGLVERTIEECIHEVMEVFYNHDTGLIHENVLADGSFSNSYEGRLLNPGHAIEAMWFIMDLGVRLKDKTLIEKAVEICNRTVEYGWDKDYEGIFYFMDVKGHPVQQLEWDQKLWWVHMETLISLAKAYKLTHNQTSLAWFKKVHDYTWSHFPDKEFGEWFGYLNRRGEVLLPLKGGKWKGCFHVPRGLYQCWNTLKDINPENNE